MTFLFWHISGANTGFGLELVLKALSEGDHVVAAVRSPEKVLKFDLSWSSPQMDAYIELAFTAFGKIDVVVNNAAFAYMGAIEESEDSANKEQFDTNIFAIVRVIRAALPRLRSQGSGLIMNISSIGIKEALATEIAPFGLQAVIVEPGYFRTSFLANPAVGASVAPPLKAYEGTPAHEARKAFELYNGKQPGNPKQGAARIWEYAAVEGLVKGKRKLLRLPLGTDTGSMMKQFASELSETAEYYEEVWKSTDFKEQ
ncbi:hypothetical protein V8C42DRAFT_361673 [Trichoderma barbatum]